MLRVLLALFLVGGLLVSLAHIAEADHGSHEALCTICVLFHVGITLVSIIVVFHRAITYWICCYFTAELRLLYHLPSAGRSPPLA
jgi:hypothetical protein